MELGRGLVALIGLRLACWPESISGSYEMTTQSGLNGEG